MIYIIIPVFNRIVFTMGCLDTLAQQDHRDFTVIVVDDGSSDGTAERICKDYSWVRLVSGTGNLWWTGATNEGVKLALELSKSKEDYILTLNNDLVVKKDYLSALLSAACHYPQSLIGSVSLDIDDPEKIHFAGTSWNARTARYRPAWEQGISYETLQKRWEVVPTDLLPGRGILIPIDLFSRIGLYDEKAFPHYMADEDLSLRAKKAGYRLLIATAAPVYNYVKETGLQPERRRWNYYKSVFTSIRSPANTRYRWNWARRHAAVSPYLYFACDMARIVKSLLFKA